jgi:tRNA(Ile)-lysidine synthase
VDLVALLSRCTFPPAGTRVACGVSGGADSTALLVLAVEAGCRATAIHVDHGLRPGSADEADVVEALVEKVGADAFAAVSAPVEPGPNLEARARAARHAALPTDALLGHTADDQAETVLLNLIRGSGLDGLAGMRRDRRPILSLRRSETTELCRTLGLTTIDDPTNDDPSFRRNRVRAELVPLLDDIAERDTVALIARQADLVREATDHLAQLAEELDPTDARAVAAAPPALARLAIREWLRDLDDERHPPDAAAVERVLAVAGDEILATEISGGWRVARREGRLRVEPIAPPG